MKILHVFNELKYSGAEIMYVDAAPIFQKLGCELYVVSTAEKVGEYSDFFRQAGYKVYHKPYARLRDIFTRIKYYFCLFKFLKSQKIDLVHVHTNKMFWGVSLCSKIAGVKSVYTFHNVFKAKFFSYLYHFFLRWSAKNVFGCVFHTISDSVFNNELKYFHNRTHKIYNWYNNARFFPGEGSEKALFRSELGISNDAFVLISVGGCSPIKRHSEIIKSLPLIKKRIPELFYLHLGEGADEKTELALVDQLGLKQNVSFVGNQRDVRKYLIASDIYVMCSIHEGIPITTIEAMGSKIPAILYDVPGLRDFNKSDITSFLIEPNYMVLADSILHLHENKKIALDLSERAKSNVDNLFCMEENVNKIFELYKV